MTSTLAWGILAPGKIAHAFAKGLAVSTTGKLVAVGSRDLGRAQTFAAEYSTPAQTVTAHGSYEALLADPAVRAVYIATPHAQHAQWAIAAARAGKHLLIEKPIAMNRAEAELIFEAARANDVFAMEAFMYRCHPQTAKLVELVLSGVIGELRSIQAAFSFYCELGPESRLINPALGGGGILDVGCYSVSLSRLLAGAALGQPFADPVEVQGMGHMETLPSGDSFDAYAIANLKFENDILAQVSSGVRLRHENVARIYGTKGWIFVPCPWTPSREPATTQIHLFSADNPKPEIIDVPSALPLYTLEADAVAAHIEARECPFMPWADTLGNMQTLDLWLAAI